MLRTFVLAVAVSLPTGTAGADITVFAAASLKTALDTLSPLYEERRGVEITVAFAGSSALARQIEAGAPADLFISANAAWMDVLAEEGLIVPRSRRNLLGNGLVLVAPADAVPPLDLGSDMRLADALGADGRLATALVDAVPAGIYGRMALESLGQWQAVAPHVAQADNVRAALALVAAGAAPLGIVYTTDAAAEPRVSVVAEFPEGSHPPIVYPAAAIAGGQVDAARSFLDWLSGPEAWRVFSAQGFVRPPGG